LAEPVVAAGLLERPPQLWLAALRLFANTVGLLSS